MLLSYLTSKKILLKIHNCLQWYFFLSATNFFFTLLCVKGPGEDLPLPFVFCLNCGSGDE